MNEIYEADEFKNLSKKEIEEIKAADEQIDQTRKLNPKPRNPRVPKKKNKPDIFDNIKMHLGEHIDTYMLIGFDTDGQEVVIVNINSPLEERALKHLIQNVVLESGMLGDSQFGNPINPEDDDE